MNQIIIFIVVVLAIFGLIKLVREGFENPNTKIIPPCPPGYVHCPSGDCKLKSDIYSPCH